MNYAEVAFYVTICHLIHSTSSDQPETGVCVKMNADPNPKHDDEYFQVNEYILLIRRDIFLDKTLLMKTIMEIPQKTVVISSPHKTGKTLNLDMLAWFFNHIILDASPIENTETLSYKFFALGEVYLDEFYSTGIPPDEVEIRTHRIAPLIAQYPDFISEHLANYPVISIRLSVSDGTDVYNTLRTTIVELFKSHSYPLATTMEQKIKDDVVSKEEKRTLKENLKRYKKMSNSQPANLKTINVTDLHTSLLFLSEIMHKHFNREVIILIDDYCDLLATEFISFDSRRIREGKLTTFLAKLLKHTVLENPYLKKAVLTTSLTLARPKVFENHRDIVFYNAMDNDLYRFYTCTKPEAEMLFEYYDINENLAREAFEYYDGYNMKPSANETTFNTWSIINFVHKKELTPFWVDSAGSEFSHNWFVIEKFRDTFQSFLDKNVFTIEYLPDLNFTHKQAVLWINTANNGPSGIISGEAIQTFFSYLCQLGYFTNVPVDYPQPAHNTGKIVVKILNKEIRQRMTEDIQQVGGGEIDLF